MKCEYCGAEVAAGQIFCRYCGTRQTPAKPAPRVETVPAAAPAPVPVQVPQPEPPQAESPWAPPQEPVSLPQTVTEIPVPKSAPVFDESTFTWQPYQNTQPAPEPEPEELLPLVAEEPQAAAAPKAEKPLLQLPARRGLAKMFFLGLITLGIYPTVIWSRIVTELNLAASRYDGERTMPYFAMLVLSPITLGIYSLYWFHTFSSRIGRELQRRGIDYKFGAKHFWLWNILGSLILAGPFVYLHKLMKAMNYINADFNING